MLTPVSACLKMRLTDRNTREFTIVAESGNDGEESVELIKKKRMDVILVGEFLMRQKNIANALHDLKGWYQRAD